MARNLEGNRYRKLEEDISRHIDYNGACNITFTAMFSFYMNAVPSARPSVTQQTPGWLDVDMQQDLLQARITNWCRTADTLYPVRTKSKYISHQEIDCILPREMRE